MTLHAQERSGWGKFQTRRTALDLSRRLLPDTYTGVLRHRKGSGTNALSLLRWDAQKRRALVSMDGPLREESAMALSSGDGSSNENWAIRESFRRSSATLASLNLRREGLQRERHSLHSGRWSWSTGAELSHRDLRNVNPGSTLPVDLLLQGFELKHTAQLKYRLLYVPEKRSDDYGERLRRDGADMGASRRCFL